MNIGKRVKDLRKNRGLKLREVSKGTGLSIPFLSDVETERTAPSLNTCQKLCYFYEITLSEMFLDVIVDTWKSYS